MRTLYATHCSRRARRNGAQPIFTPTKQPLSASHSTWRQDRATACSRSHASRLHNDGQHARAAKLTREKRWLSMPLKILANWVSKSLNFL